MFKPRHDVAKTAELERRVSLLERELESVRRHVDEFRIDYQGLYEKVRVQLSKLRKRADDAESAEPDPAKGAVARGRQMLIQRKLGRMGG